ncbi:hypothetical protein GCM10010912_29580 [Paenibacillus albidus]|uniref:Uncharacterized protein n=1 Tax=Paenibacillus albidus TaxID=2041023 RepID=A0A917FH48_9BACL|nr:hypothetical protein GCM10010912_29580 [Paenibacillus albidus]
MLDFAEARQRVLDPPSWALRNYHLYKKMGFVQTGQSDPDPSGQVLYWYKRTIADV